MFEISFIMPGMTAWVALAVALLLLLASATISGSEVAFFSLSPREKDRLDSEERAVDGIVERLLDKSERLMAAILIGNNLVNVAIIMLFTLFMNGAIDHSHTSGLMVFLLESVILTFLLLLFGEVLPKVYATHQALWFARMTARLMQTMVTLFRPFISLLVGSTGIINRRLAEHIADEVTVEDLSDALKLAPQVARNKDEKKMLEGIIEFAGKTVKDAMTSRSEMTTIEIGRPFSEVLRLVVDQRYSRIPVYEGTEDHIRGILYIKDLLPYLNQNDSFRWSDLIRPAYFVPENKMIDDLLDDFRSRRMHMAIVVDEFSGTSGLITMEDVLEEIVGEIRDEYDEDEQTWQRVGQDEWVFEARTSLNDFCRVIDIDADLLGDKADNCESVGGLLLEIKQNFPRVNESIRYKGLTFTVIAMDRRRIERVRVKK
ncbi:MAG: gliding motility-associated protein GldE [Bacteroidales bacterium]|nr:gliding motility-associated protein GldE [Bacteroidales bacterium]